MEAIATGAAANISSETAKGIFHDAKRHIRYVVFYQRYVKNFEDKLQRLIDKRSSVQQDIVVAERNVQKIKADVQGWCDRVDKVIAEEEDKVKDLQVKAINKCFFGFCPNIKCRHKLSRKAEEDAAAFDELIKECQFNSVGYHDLPQLIVDTNFEAFQSRERVFNDIMESLKDSTASMIGVYGMPGVGKTSLVKEVERQLQEAKLFNSVVRVTVSQKPDIQKIQDEIAESLGLKIEEKSTVVRASRLFERLNQGKNQEKRVLIILDNIWKKLDLEEVGIPFGSQHKGCKILLTSRNENVLSNGMGATMTFQLRHLDEKEAWEFFKKMVGDSFESDKELQSTAIEVAKRCAGLPLAIATVARALQKKSLFVWNEALRQLQRHYSENPSEISAEVYSAIELSINNLRGEDLKKVFLLCSLLHRDSNIEDLLRYTIGLGLINGVETMKEGRDALLTMMSTLKESCLLLDSNTNDECFDVHDLTYIVAKSMASKDNQVFALREEDVLIDWPDAESMKKCSKICLQYPTINRLPDNLNCPQLSLFLLYSNDLSLTLPDDFFKEATNLNVLDLASIQFSSLPSSICKLTSLSTLCLDYCKLGDNITIIGKLNNLEILSLLKSDITFLPKEIGQLVKLKLLDVSRCAMLKTISDGVLSSLSRLEELYMGGTSIQWGQSSVTLADLHALSRLSTLEVQIPDAKAAPHDFFQELQKLKRYKIFIGEEWEWERFGKYRYSRTLKLRLNTGMDDLDLGIKKLLKKTEDLHLGELKGVKIALQELTEEESISHLKNLHIQNGLDTEYIINDEFEFPQLRSLTLHDLPKLISFFPQHETGATSSLPQHELPLFNEKISFPYLENLWLKSINVTRVWHNQLSSTSFSTYEKLTTLKIEGCGSLKHLFSFSMAKCLVHLTNFEIIRCYSLREIIFMEEIEEETQTGINLSLFPRLKSLELTDLQHLIGFCSDYQTQVIEFSTLKSLRIYNCPKLEGFIYRSSMKGNQCFSNHVLFDNKVSFPSLERVWARHLEKLKMIWENPLPPNSFPKLRVISITNLSNLKYIWKNGPKDIFSFKNLHQISVGFCKSLKNVFPASVARDLPQLSDLAIFNCGVEEIISKVEEGLDSETTVTFEFDKLSYLRLWWLPECKCFYPGRHTTKWPMLKEVTAAECGEMKIFGTQLVTHNQQLDSQPPLFLVEKVIPKLQRLQIGADYIAMISGGQLPNNLFHKIKAFRVEGNRAKFVNDFQISFLERFYNLEELCISVCEIKELFYTEGDTGNKGMYDRTLSTIRKIELTQLHKLKHSLWKQDVQVDRILPNLETLEVNNCWNLMSLGSSSTSFQNITTLKVWGCKGMKYLDTCLAVQGLSQLKQLIIRECISMKEIVGSGEDEATCDIIFSRLKSLELVSLPRLKRFCSGNHTFGFPCLEEVIVSGCPELELFCKGVLNAPLLQSVEYGEGKEHWSDDLDSTVQQLHSKKVGYQGNGYLILSEFSKSMEIWKEKSVDFKNLQDLEVEECNSLKYIFSVSMALELVQLEHITVKRCPMMEYIIKKEAEESAMDTVFLPNLKMIRLESCSELKSFCMGNITLQCPSLHTIKVDDCPMMYAMTCTRDGENTPFFNDKVLCANLEGLELSSTNIQNLWPDEPLGAISSSVHKLQILIVEGCHNLEYIFPPFLVKNFVELVQLSLVDCDNLEVIFTDEATAEEEGITEAYWFTKLNLLELSRLPKLGTFCHGENSETDSPTLFNQKVVFPNLIHLTIQGIGKCRKIWHDKPTMNSFNELTMLWVKDCERLSNILPFSMVKRLEKLETLAIDEGKSVEEIIGPDDDHLRNSNESHAVTSAQLIELKSITKFVFPKMRELYLRVLPKLKGFYSKVHTTEWPSLKLLAVSDCSKVENLAREYINFGETQGESQPLIPVQQPLFWVTEGIWHQFRQFFIERTFPLISQEAFPNLEELHVIRNSNMKEICHGALPNLYFPRLTRMCVIYCQMLEEIIVLTTDEITNGIVFSQLNSLELVNLPILSSFCSGKYTLAFPSLEEVIIRGCPKMEFFTKGKLSTPMLHGLQSTKGKYVGHWEGDLNVILQQLFIEKVFPSLEDLELSSINIQRVWKHKLLATYSYAQNITCLTIEGCHNLNCLFSCSMVKSFVQLKKLKVENCYNVENVISVKGLTKEEMMNQKTFRVLEFLLLKDLPKLTRFCHGNYFEFPLLTSLSIETCPTLKTFISAAEGNNSEIASPTLFDEKAAFPCLEELSIVGLGNWRTIWQKQPTNCVRINFANN
ncbi:Detected protein of confused Function [Hibiscus syriacus]|uniref:Detected protein of confused Function n=1 Tax=Hibiscus syriacus TaxID=106335 RepID=A0A6A2YHJ4_HIBSY|nr:Detected protein of confused Function [Hibiscus syriacus]